MNLIDRFSLSPFFNKLFCEQIMRQASRSELRNQRMARKQTRKLLLESLEAREMMAADLIYTTDLNNIGSDDLTLTALNNGGAMSLQLLRTANMSQVASVNLDDSGDVVVNVKREQTTAGDIDPFADTLRIDLNSLSLINSFVAASGGMLTVNFEGGVEVPELSEDHLFLSSVGTANVGFGLSVITTADIAVNNVTASINGDLLLRSNPNSSTSGAALDPDKVLSFPEAAVSVNGGSLNANNITLEAKSTKTLLVGADSVMDGQIRFAEVVVNSSANVAVLGSAVINATGNLIVLAESNITTDIGRVPTDDGDTSDDDSTEDAAIAISVINGTSSLTIGAGSSLTAGGFANLTSNNLVNSKSDANGTLGSSDSGGITLAMTTVTGDTVMLVDGGASIIAAGNVSLLANSIRTATTLATATPGGATDDGSSSTSTRGETELDSADASTSEGDVTFAAAIAIGNVSGNTYADLNGATVKSTSGNVNHQAFAKHTVVNKADGSTTTSGDDTGIGVAVAIQHINSDAEARIRGNSSVDGNTVLVHSKMDGSSLALDSISGPTGTDSSGDVSFAGSLAIGVTVANARSIVSDTANVNTNGANLILQSNGSSTTNVRALPHENASGKSLGIGASFALNIVDHTTEAMIRDGAVVANVNNLTLSAISTNTQNTETRAGASGGTAFAGAFSILVSNDDTIARLGTGPGTTGIAGSLIMTADSSSLANTIAQGDAEGGEDAAIGAALALNYVNQVTDVRTNRNLAIGGAMSLQSTSAGKSDTNSVASAKGGKKDNAGTSDDTGTKAADARTDADSRATDSGARTSSSTQSNPSASNSDGSISVAAAFSINLPESETRALIPDGRTVTVSGASQIRALANHDAKTIADASSASAGDLGVGIAVALMSPDVINVASIGNGSLTTAGLVLEAGMRNVAGDQKHNFEATATSGSGAADNSIAGSFAAGVNTVKTQAVVSPSAAVNATGGSVDILATSSSNHQLRALPKENAAGKSLGLGLSFAIGIVDEVTQASIENNATLTNANNVKLKATSDSNKDLETRAGAAGDFAFAGAVSILIDNEDTIARVGLGAGVTTIDGNLEVNADHHGTSTVKADGDGQGGSDAGVGVALTLAFVNENTFARVERDLNVSGNLSILSKSTGSSSTDSKASATGAEKKDGETTDSQSQSQRDSANSTAAAGGARDSSSTGANPSASTNSGGSIAIAAAVALNITEAESHAVIPANRNITVGGNTTVRSQADHDAVAISDGAATLSGGDLAVGVAVSLIRSQIVNEALIGTNTSLTTDGLTLEATMPASTDRHTLNAKATSGAGGGDNGIAGSVTVGIYESQTTATVAPGAQINGLSGQPAIVRALSNTKNTGEARPNEAGGNGSSSFGVGGSFALVRTQHAAHAIVSDNALISSGASSLTIEALADHQTTAVAENGAKNAQEDDNGGGGGGDSDGSLGIGAGVVLALLNNSTMAKLGVMAGTTSVAGNSSVRASHKHIINSQADGNADGGETGIGISFGLNQIDDKVSADINRSLSVGGDLTLESYSNIASTVETKASASGTSEDSKNSDQEAASQRNPDSSTNTGASSNTGSSSSLQTSSSESSQANSSASGQSGSSSGGLGVAASVAFNIVEIENKATIGNGVQITANGNVRVAANGHFDATTKATGTSVTTEDSDTVAAGVGFSYADVDSLATVSTNASLKGTNVTVEAVTTEPSDQAVVNDFVVWGVAASGGSGDYSAAASVALNIIDVTMQARSQAGSSIKATNNLTVQSEIDLKPQTLAITGAFALDGDAGGGALAFAEVDVNSSATVDGNADAGNKLNIAAENTILTVQATIPEFDMNVDVTTIAVAGAAANGSTGVAAAVSVDDYSVVTDASIGEGSQINQAADIVDLNTQSIEIAATSNTDITSLAGAIGIATDGSGLGAGLQLAILNKTTTAKVGSNADVQAKSAVKVEAISNEKMINVSSNAGIASDNGLAFSASVYVIDTVTHTTLGNESTTQSDGNVSLNSAGTFAATGVAGAVGIGGDTGVGASNITLVHNDKVEAWVGSSATVDVDGANGLSVTAISKEDIIGLALAGGASGSIALAGSATVSVLNELTSARIQDGAHVIANNGAAANTPSVVIIANDTTTIVTVAGSLAASGSTSVGVGANVSTLNKDTTASIGSNVVADVEGNIEVTANSLEDFTVVAAGVAAGGGPAIAVDAAVTILDIATRAFIGDDPRDQLPNLGPGNVHARGNIIVDADDVTEIDKVVGVLAASSSGSGAAGVAVSTIDKLTEAFIGQNAVVTADGLGGPVSVKNGLFEIGYAPSTVKTQGIEAGGGSGSANATSSIGELKSAGEVGAPNVDKMETHAGGQNGANDASNTQQRTLLPALRNDFRGLSVTASNRDEIEVYTISLALGAVAVAVSSGVSVVDNDTLAYISGGAVINANLATGHADQSVNVAAGSDYSQIVVDGTLAVSSSAAVAPAVGVALVDLTTKASIAGTVKANNDILVEAYGQEDVLLVGFGLAGGSVGVGATASVMDFKTTTGASIGSGSVVFAKGDILVRAHDASDLDIISGAVGAGFAAGIGAGVGVMMMTKSTTAVIESNAIVDALGDGAAGLAGTMTGSKTADQKNFATSSVHGVVVQATSNDNYLHMAVVAGVGWVGVAGGISISIIDSDTYATIQSGANVNQTNNNIEGVSSQSVYVNAGNIVEGFSFAGAVAGGAGAVAGAVDFGTINNDAFATIEAGAQVSAKNDVEVNALGIKNVQGFSFSGSGGVVALAASVSVWSIGTTLEKDYSNDQGASADSSQGKDGQTADDDAASQAETGHQATSSNLATFPSSGNNNNTSTNRVHGATQNTSSKLSNKAPSKQSILDRLKLVMGTEPGTTAKIAAGAKVSAGDDINVNANEDTNFTSTIGTVAGGLGAVGASVSVNSVASNATARAGGTLSAGGDISLTSNLDLDTSTLAIAGSVGFVGLGAAVVSTSDASVSQAYIDNGATITSAKNVNIMAGDDRVFKGETGQISVGAAAGGASFVVINVDNPNQAETSARIGDNVKIGSANKPVQKVTVEAKPKLHVDANTFGLAGGIGAASVNFAQGKLKADTHAKVGDASIYAVGDVSITANPDIHAEITGTGVAAGGLAVGTMLASLEMGRGDNVDEVQASVANGATIHAKKVSVVADSDDYLDVQSVAGSGAVIAGAGASSTLKSDHATLATVGTGSSPLSTSVNAETFTLKATHNQDIDSQADTVTLGLLAGTGAALSNQVTGGATALVGDATITAHNVMIFARNDLDKDRYGSGNGVNLATASVSGGSFTGLVSQTNIGTAAQPMSSSVVITPGSIIRATGSTDAPGFLAIDAVIDTNTIDRVNAEEVAVGAATTVARGEITLNTKTNIDVSGATIENKFGEAYLTTRTNGINNAMADVTAASGISAIVDAQVKANATSKQEIHLDNAKIVARDVRIFAGMDRNRGTNTINNSAIVQGFVASLFPSFTVPKATSLFTEINVIDIDGSTQITAFGDIDLLAREGIGGNDRAFANGKIFSLSALPIDLDANTQQSTTSTNEVNIEASAKLIAGASSAAIVQIVPTMLNNVPFTIGGQNVTPGSSLNSSAKAALSIPSAMNYHYASLDLDELTIDFYVGFIVKAVANSAPGATAGHYYRFKPSTPDEGLALSLHDENYADTSRWVDLGILNASQTQAILDDGKAIYSSDTLLKFKEQMQGRFAVVKPVEMENARLVYRNIGNMLYVQRAQLLDWIGQHSGDVEAIARYVAQLEKIEELMLELELAEPFDLTNPAGKTAVRFKQNLDTIFVEVPSLLSSPGSIFIEANAGNLPPGALVGKYMPLVSGDALVARAGATINLFNKTPFMMASDGALIDSNQRVTVDDQGNYLVLEPGNVYVNNTPLTATQGDINLGIHISQEDLGPLSDYGLSNLSVPLPDIDQDLYLNGDIINEAGAVKIKNVEGSIFVNGEIRGATVELFAVRDFNLNTEGWFHTNRDPRQYIDFKEYQADVFNQAEQLRSLTGNDIWTNLALPTTIASASQVQADGVTLSDAISQDVAKILAQGDILITARYLNVNGLIQSGSDKIELDIESDFVAPNQNATFSSENGIGTLPGVSFGDAGVPVSGYWDASRQAFVIDKIKPEGGKIQLVGQLISTGNGRLQVANGFPSVDIENDSPYTIVIEGIDTTTPREGIIEITDTTTTNPLKRTQYKFNSATNQILQTTFNGVEIPSDIVDGVDNDGDGDIDDNQVGGIHYQQTGATISHPFGANLQWQPTLGSHYVWTEGQRFTEQQVITYIKDNSWYTDLLFFIEFDSSNVSDVQTNFLDDEPTSVSELPQPGSGEYFDASAYSIKYLRTGNPAVELTPDTMVRHPAIQINTAVFPPLPFFAPGTKVYKYVGPTDVSAVLSEEDYSDTSRWVDSGIAFGDLLTFDKSEPHRYDSSYKNYKVTLDGPKEIDGGNKSLLKKIIEQGKKDLYTQTLKADYPIAIQFTKSPASPQISVVSVGSVLFVGNVKSPDFGAVTINSTSGSVETDGSVAIYGASPTVYAAKEVKLNIEGNQGPLSVLAGGPIQLIAISQDNISSSFVINSVVSLNGDIMINAKDGIASTNSVSKVTGDLVELYAATGEIGSDALAVRVESNKQGDGGLTAYAEKDIHIQQTAGDLLLIRPVAYQAAASVESLVGDVQLTATSGSILDADNEFHKKANNPQSGLVGQFLNKGILNGQWTTGSLKYQAAAGLVKFLYPHTNFLGQTPPTEATERVNVRGQKITLSAPAAGKEIGHVGDAIIINDPKNFTALTDEQQSILANANPTDVVGVAYGLYRFLGTDQASVDLTQENFNNTVRWLKLETHFATGLNRTGENSKLLKAGDRVRVEHDVDHYGVYEYVGPTTTLNLLEINYLDRTRWIKLQGAAATDGGPANLGHGMIITNKFVVDSLILRPIQDVNVDAEDFVRSTAHYRTAIESVDDLRILRSESGDDMFLRARGDFVDVGERIMPAAIASAGEVVISALGNVTGLGDAHTLRTQIAPDGSLRILANANVDVTQIDVDTTLNGSPVFIHNLRVDRIDADGLVDIDVQQGNLIVNHITSTGSIDLQAQNAILDAFPAHQGTYVNLHIPVSGSPGNVILNAASIGTGIAPLTVDIEADIETGDLVTSTTGHQWLSAVSPLVATSLNSSTGNIVVQAEDDISIGDIQAVNGNVSITAVGSLLDLDTDGADDITAKSIALQSTTGSIGTTTNDLEINTADTATTTLSAIADKHVRIVETSGRLNIQNASSLGGGDVRLSTMDQSTAGQDIMLVSGGTISAVGGQVTLNAGDNVTIDGSIAAEQLNIFADIFEQDAVGTAVSITGPIAVATAELTTGDQSDFVSITSTITAGWTIRTGGGDDQVTGSVADDFIYGGAGTDNLRGGLGNDYLNAGSGIGDHLSGEDGDDTLMGSGDGAETDINFSDAVFFGDVLLGGAGNDTIHGLGGADLIDAGDDDDTVYAGDGSDLVRGGLGNDKLYADRGLADEIHGGSGDDHIVGSNNGSDLLIGDSGNDLIYGQAGMDTIDGGDGADWIDGGADADTIFGAAGNDELKGGSGGDLIRGGDGDDFIEGSDDAADQLYGEAGRDRILGMAGNDTVSGGDGDDILDGGAGDDLIEGDAGSDVIIGGAHHDKLYALNAAGLGDDTSVNYLYGDFGTNGNELTSGQDQLFGDSGRDLLYGEAGDDLIDDDVSIAGVPQPNASLDFIDYGSDEGADPTTFNLPNSTQPPALLPAPPEMMLAVTALPSGISDLGRWSELAGSASGLGLGRSGVTSTPSIATTATGSIVAWSDSYAGRSRIYVAQFDGAVWQELPGIAGAGVSSAANNSSNPSLIVTSSGMTTVAWTERTSNSSQIQLAQYDPAANAGQGAWVGLGSSLSASGLSNSGNADNAQLIETSFGLVVAWEEVVAGVKQIYARAFNGSAWTAIGAGSDTGGGITNAAASANVRDVTIATQTGRIALAWSQMDPATSRRHVYVRESTGTTWNQINGSATGTGVSGVFGGLSGTDLGRNDQPTLAYHNNYLYVGWQRLNRNESIIGVVRFENSTSALSLVDQFQTTPDTASPKLAANSSGLELAWIHHQNRIYVRQWNGLNLIEAVPGEASGLGVSSGGISFDGLSMARDAQGHTSIAWLNGTQADQRLMVRRNAGAALGTVYTATATGQSIQQILDSVVMQSGDVIVVDGVLNGNVTVAAADAGVTIVGLPGAQIVGNVTIAANNVTLQRLNITGNVLANFVSSTLLRENSLSGRIQIHSGANSQVIHNELSGVTSGIVISGGADGVIIRQNTIEQALNGIALGDPSDGLPGGANNTLISENKLLSTGTGIRIRVASSANITGNFVGANLTGLDLDAPLTGIVARNDFRFAAVGVRYEFPAVLSDNYIAFNQVGVLATVNSTINGFGYLPSAPNRISRNQIGIELTGRMQNQHVYRNGVGVTGSGDLISSDLDHGNLIELNDVGVNVAGAVHYQKISQNLVGIQAADNQSIFGNTINGNTISVDVVGRQNVTIEENTFYTAVGTHVKVYGGSQNVQVYHNILWTADGYNLFIANDGTTGFDSDHNVLHTSGNGKIAFWTKDFNDLLDWQEDVALFDLNSIGHTVVNPNWSEPRFLNLARGDFRMFDQVAGQRLTSSAVDFGAHKQSSNETTQSAHLSLISPDLYEDWHRDVALPIRWNSFGNSQNSRIRIDLYEDTPSGPIFMSNITTNAADNGLYLWKAADSLVPYGTQGLRVQISWADNPAVFSRSTEAFVVPLDTQEYFVNNTALAGDVYTTAMGSNRNTGTSAADPKPYPNNVLRNYTLGAGATMFVDTGNYALLQPLVISPLPGLDDDTQFSVKGSGVGSVTLTHANPFTVAPIVQIIGAGDIYLSEFSATGGQTGISVEGSADAIRLKGIVATENSLDGVLIAAGAKVTEIKDSVISHNGRDGIRAIGQLQQVTGSNLSNNDATGLLMQDGGGASISGNVVHSNATGLDVKGHADVLENRIYNNSAVGLKATEANVLRNTIYSNAIGIQSDTSSLVNNLVYGNDLIGISLIGIGGSEVVNNTIHQAGGTGLQVASGFGHQLKNNILWADGGQALEATSAAFVGTTSNFNDYHLTGGGNLSKWNGNNVATLAAFQAISGSDGNSYSFDPQFVDPAGSDGVIGYVDANVDGRDDDFHLKSTVGSYHGGSLAPVATDSGKGLPTQLAGAWAVDAVHSMAIDAGDFASSFKNEPAPNGGRINLGAYGNTAQASQSAASYLFVLSPNGGESWLTNSTHNILWNANDLNSSSTVRVELMQAGAVVLTIAATAPNTGVLPWTVPAHLVTGSDYTLRIVSMNGSLVDSSDAAFTIVHVNQAPTNIQLSNNSVKEKLLTGTVIGQFDTVDSDSANPFSYSLVVGAGDTDNARFTIVGNELRLAQGLDFESQPTHSIRVRTTDNEGASFEKVFTIQVTNAPIKVTGLYVRGSGWNTNYLAMLAANNIGSATGGFRLVDGPNQLANSSNLTWQTIDQISVTFDEGAVINPNAIRLLNANDQDLAFAAGGYSYDASTRTARWTLNTALTPGKFLISLEAQMIQDGALANLDGEWTTSSSTFASSGNDLAGGDLNFLFNYLPGDVSRNGQTNPGDVNLLRSIGTAFPDATNYWLDVTGNNQINPGDVNFVRSLGTVVLASQSPTNPPPPRTLGAPAFSISQAELDKIRDQAILEWSHSAN